MNPPLYYSEWMQLFNQIKEYGQEDEKIIAVLERGKLEWTSGVADKIVNCTYEVIDFKLKYTTRLFQQELDHSRGEEAAIISSIINARYRFELLYRLCRLSIFPNEIKESLINVVSKYVGDSQDALLESAKHDRTGQLAYTIRHNGLLKKHMQAPAAAAHERIEQKESNANSFQSKRRVLY
ncbi:hypothetical protein L3i20_v221740 [Paenibacillus sp. L3-i20]|nr:hypothetical protein L3i20_v221740 [Paenibacillus sp. L3-i20]